MIIQLNGLTPKIGKGCFIHESAYVIGDVEFGDDCSVWFYAVIRGDVHSIRIGRNTNIQDFAMLHCTHKKFSLTIGNNATIGHHATLHGCVVEDNVLIGINSIVLDGAQVHKNSIIGAGAVVLPGTIVPEGALFAGNPARLKKNLSPEEIAGIAQGAKNYMLYKTWYK